MCLPFLTIFRNHWTRQWRWYFKLNVTEFLQAQPVPVNWYSEFTQIYCLFRHSGSLCHYFTLCTNQYFEYYHKSIKVLKLVYVLTIQCMWHEWLILKSFHYMQRTSHKVSLSTHSLVITSVYINCRQNNNIANSSDPNKTTTSRENVSSGSFDQVSFKPAYSATKTS